MAERWAPLIPATRARRTAKSGWSDDMQVKNIRTSTQCFTADLYWDLPLLGYPLSMPNPASLIALCCGMNEKL